MNQMSSPLSSPLRYPGGKSILTDFFVDFIDTNQISDAIYIEPYCGGAGAAVNLLMSDVVSEIHLNDANYSIFSFWHSLVTYGDEFVEKLVNTDISLDEWFVQRAILKNTTNKKIRKQDILSNGFATFFLNRCNRSGILSAGPIGGMSIEQQEQAKDKIDARFKKEVLVDKLLSIIELKDRIYVSNEDALNYLRSMSERFSKRDRKRCFVYLDPPYYIQGSSLYLNYYKHNDHSEIAEFLSGTDDWRWVLSYDNVVPIRTLYKDFNQYSFYLNYSAHQTKLGNELMIFSKNSKLPKSMTIKEMVKTKKRIELIPQ
jgi:DNA adenine methylase